MTLINKHSISKVVITATILIIFGMNGFSYVLQNGSGKGYNEGNGEAALMGTDNIESDIIRGAGYFFQARADIQLFLQRVELQDFYGLNYDELLQLVNRASYHIRLAGKTYNRLVRVAKQTPYKKDVIVQLKAFDYNAFMTAQGLNAAVFARVGEYLGKGDITGTFRHTRANLESLASLLAEVKKNLLSNRLPELALVWQLNETAADAALFGSYTARVFYALH